MVKQPEDDAFFLFPPDSRHYLRNASGISVSSQFAEYIWNDQFDTLAILDNAIDASLDAALVLQPGGGVVAAGRQVLEVYQTLREIQDLIGIPILDSRTITLENVPLQAGQTYWVDVNLHNYCWSGSWLASFTVSHAIARVDVESVNLQCVAEGVCGDFTIFGSAGPHGTVIPNGNVVVPAGESLTLNATPNVGYTVDRWLRDGAEVASGVSSYTLTNIQSDHNVTVTFKTPSDPDEETSTIRITDPSDWGKVLSVGPNSNFCADSQITVLQKPSDPGNGIAHGLIRFDVDQLPAGSEIRSVQVRLRASSAPNPASDITLVAIPTDWDGCMVTWNTQPMHGGAFCTAFPLTSGPGDWVWDSGSAECLKTKVQQWLDTPSSNHGFYVVANNDGDDVRFWSGASVVPSSEKPRLMVTYKPPSPPDLVCTQLLPDPLPVSGTFFVGDSVDWNVTVQNVSDVGHATTSSVGYYLGDSPTDFGDRVNQDSIDPLSPGGSDTADDRYTFGDQDVGQKYLICRANHNGEIEEVDTGNNSFAYGPVMVRRRTGSLTVTLYPASVVADGRWRLTSGPDTGWKESQDTIVDLPLGEYTLEYENVAGFVPPSSVMMTIEQGMNETEGVYVAFTPTPEPTLTPTSTSTCTATATPSQTSTQTPSPTTTPTVTETANPTPTSTETATSTPTLTSTVTPTSTQSPTWSSTLTATPSDTPTVPDSPTITTTATPTPCPGCVGDCDGDGSVTVDEILIMVNVALGEREVSDCRAGDCTGDGEITVDEILQAVGNALNGCA